MNINSRASKINFTGFKSGAIASFTGLREAPIKVRAYINAIQEGSGNPAPDNIRPIIGRNSVTITVNAVDHMISLGDTVYGGSLDVTTGVLTVTHQVVDLSDLTFTYNDALKMFLASVGLKKPQDNNTIADIKCESYQPTYYNELYDRLIDNRVSSKSTTVTNGIAIRDLSYTDAQTFNQNVSGKLVYALITPITVQLTPTQVEQLLGTNNIFSDSGNVEVYYVTI